MFSTAHTLELGGAKLNVIDYGGTGPDILLVHSPGYCAPAWDFVARELDGRAHAWALDLPGHGHSGGDLVDAASTRQLIADVAAALGLTRPVLAGLDFSGYYVLAVAAEHPSMARAVVSQGGFAVRERALSSDMLDLAVSSAMTEELRGRFLFGVTGSGTADREELVDQFASRSARDWLLTDIEPGLRHEIEWSMKDLPDGTWIHLPRPETVQAGFRVTEEDPFFPEPGLFEKVKVPTWLLLAQGGPDDDLFDAARRIGRSHEHVTFVGIDGGFGAHYQAAARWAEVLLTAAETP
ncbi:MAG: alpha/beta hydrolase [Dermatophilaceae bacterium]